ncbi:Protein PAT1-like protein [Bienertia sinuspersici]
MDGFSDARRLNENSTDAELFDASQYAFFGNDTVEEVELGGLEDEEDIPSGSSAAEWGHDADYPTWYDLRVYHPENEPESKQWSSQPYVSSIRAAESRPLHRTSSYPEPPPHLLPQRHQNFSSEPIPMPRTSFPSYSSGSRPHILSPNHHAQHVNNPYLSGGPQMTLHSQGSFSSPLSGLPHGSHLAANPPQCSPPGHSVDVRSSSQWLSRANPVNNILQHQLPHQNGLMPQLIAQQQQQQQQHRMHLPGPPLYGNLTGAHSQLYGPHMNPSPPMLNKFDAMMGLPDLRDQRPKSSQKNRQNLRYPQQGFDSNGGWPVYRSKYMSADEIENILRMQLAATHSNDPYVDDYYHQACLFKKSTGARLKHHFCPTQLRDLPPRARPTDEPHPFLQVEALGRIPFSSIRRPKPLLEVDPLNATTSGCGEHKVIDKPLEQEPMLAARVTIEDCLCLLLDVDDIDRFLQFNQFPDGGSELRQRRQSQLEGLAASLQLVDPLGKGGQAPKDDFVFLRIVSLPKGRKLLVKYLAMVSPGTELLRIVCMAIFRHLRFLFGVLPSDPSAAEVTAYLSNVVSSRVSGMDFNGLGACLAAVVCSSEPPPLRPIGSSAGDGASVVVKSVLDRAAELLRDGHAGSSYNNVPNSTFWQASFDEFFNLLLKYCLNKYDSIVQPLQMQGLPNIATIGSDVGKAIKKEMPVELLRASLPHTNEYQRKLLLDLAQRSVPLVGSSGHVGNGSLDC